MKVGTIVQNMYQPSYKSYLIYRGCSGGDAKCIWVVDTGMDIKMQLNARFPKNDVLYDREHFPIVGELDFKSLIANAVFNEVSRFAKSKRNIDDSK